MPATEQTWRNQKLLHVVFAVSAVVMAIATIWLVAKDQNREWKDLQLADRKKDAWMLASRRDFLADQYSDKVTDYEMRLRLAKVEPIDPELIEDFKGEVLLEDQRLAGADTIEELGDQAAEKAAATSGDAGSTKQFDRLDAALTAFNEAATKVAEARDVAQAEDASSDAPRQLAAAETAAIAARDKLGARLGAFVAEARRRENKLVGEKKSANGVRTAVVSKKGLMVHEGAGQEALDKVQAEIDQLDEQLAELTAEISAAKTYRMDLEAIVADVNSQETEIQKELATIHTELTRLTEQVKLNTSNVGEWITRWPVLSALYNGNIRIDQIWLPDLTINYNFSQVARFDRCTTCHRAISKTAPGTATDPLYPNVPKSERDFTATILAPERPEELDLGAAATRTKALRDLYGLVLSDSGIIKGADVTVHYTIPESPAAIAGLEPGDVIRSVGGVAVQSPDGVKDGLLKLVKWESPVAIEIHRGLDQPFTAHPRLDLYLTDLSPHPQKDFGCTICHDGQGSGTEFKWTSHTPDDWKQEQDWIRNHGWFDNHHWIFPMRPARFAESNCLKCHHDKGGLEPSERFPEPPAASLVEGWTLVEEYGCYGCHEMNGYNGPNQRIGPDVRLEPAFHELAQAILRDENLSDEQRELAERIVVAPDDSVARNELLTELSTAAAEGETELSARTLALVSVLKDVETPGVYRKSGPSLRHLAAKVEFDWLYSWIRKPSDFRPTTKMPQFFMQYEHLTEEEDAAELHASLKFEPIEILALSRFLLNNSVEFEYQDAPENVTEEPSAERGAWLFESRGCLACHSHGEFPEAKANQGPDLSEIAAKLNTTKGRKWLYSWLKQPHRYHLRTSMPVLYLDPIVETGEDGRPSGAVTDPAADIAEYLLSVTSDWKPQGIPAPQLDADQEQALAELALEWLKSDAIPEARAKKYLADGVPDHMASKLKADERVLLGMNAANRVDKQLEFVARRTIGKYGCFGCHDIPGYEDAKPIGTALADWGRKESSKLAFENIGSFLEKHGIDPSIEVEYGDGGKLSVKRLGHDDHAHGGHGGHLDPGAKGIGKDDSYFVQAINKHVRDGFAWQKLRYPRSYDYKTTRNKSFNDRLRMPKFPFTDDQREAVMTFLLGLVSEPPAPQYVYAPTGAQKAIVEGRQVLERFNCAGCHTLKMEQWQFGYRDGDFDTASTVDDFPFLKPAFTPKDVAASLAVDQRGMMHATVHGMPVLDEETGQVTWVDEDREPISPEELAEAEAEEGETIPVFYKFTLWRNALVGGEPRLRGIEELLIPADRTKYGPAEGQAYPAWGGDLARYLFPKVIEKAKERNPQVNGKEAWGWLPPPLMEEGEKVQTDWLHGFLMDPSPLRPAAVMRMPNFKMSSAEAAKLTNYFAAASGAEFPYEYKPQQSSSYVAAVAAGDKQETKLDEAMRIVTSGNYCVKCHAVSDFQPQGDRATFGPPLSEVYRRLRPDYVRDWVANPNRILPYTGMPVNIPYRPDDPQLGGVSQDLYHGTSLEQLRGLVDLLMNFDAYAKGRTDVSGLVQESAAQSAAGSAAGGE
ncbi:MAG: c-type cytochrome [Pirellulales bacterium]|nr:c-type cytochrome [Pirellulales bacterium]